MNLLYSLASSLASVINVSPLPQVQTSTVIPTILSIVFGIIGALALLFITISGLRYITSAGDPQKAVQSRDGIVYALVGLAIAISAEAIVSYYVGQIG